MDTHPRADRLKEVWLGAGRPWSSGWSGRGSGLSVFTGSGLGAWLKPPKGIATLRAMDGQRLVKRSRVATAALNPR